MSCKSLNFLVNGQFFKSNRRSVLHDLMTTPCSSLGKLLMTSICSQSQATGIHSEIIDASLPVLNDSHKVLQLVECHTFVNSTMLRMLCLWKHCEAVRKRRSAP